MMPGFHCSTRKYGSTIQPLRAHGLLARGPASQDGTPRLGSWPALAWYRSHLLHPGPVDLPAACSGIQTRAEQHTAHPRHPSPAWYQVRIATCELSCRLRSRHGVGPSTPRSVTSTHTPLLARCPLIIPPVPPPSPPASSGAPVYRLPRPGRTGERGWGACRGARMRHQQVPHLSPSIHPGIPQPRQIPAQRHLDEGQRGTGQKHRLSAPPANPAHTRSCTNVRYCRRSSTQTPQISATLSASSTGAGRTGLPLSCRYCVNPALWMG